MSTVRLGRVTLAAVVLSAAVVAGLGLATGLAWKAVSPDDATPPRPAVLSPDQPPPDPAGPPRDDADVHPSASPPLPALAGRVTAGTHTFPLAARADYGRDHHDYAATDLFAACGTPVLAPVDGRIAETVRVDRWDPATNLGPDRGGLAFSLVGVDGVRYYGSHLATVVVAPGDAVQQGQQVGTVGETGSAAGTGCHLHLGISPAACGPGDWFVRRGVVSPYPYLQAWADGDDALPSGEVVEWFAKHGCPTEPSSYP